MNTKILLISIPFLSLAWFFLAKQSDIETPINVASDVSGESEPDSRNQAASLVDLGGSASPRVAQQTSDSERVSEVVELPNATPDTEVIDQSGLKHDEKIGLLLRAQAGFLNKLATGTIEEIADEENYFVIQCAIAIMRERGDVQYEFDMDPKTGELNGFRLKDVPEGHIGVASSHGKYAISLLEFPELEAARQRIFANRQEFGNPQPIADSHLALLDDLMMRALLSLGVDQPPEKETK